MEKAVIKFNGGNLALLCSKCSVIIKTGKDFTKEEMDAVFVKLNGPRYWVLDGFGLKVDPI